jgi:hypothetical protein
MDASIAHAAFLGLWQVCEAVALSEHLHGDPEKVCARIQSFADDTDLPGSGFKRTLREFSRKRNDLVHRGLRDIDDDDVNDFLLIANTAVDRLRGLAQSLTMQTALEAFYQYRTAGDDHISATISGLQHLQERRSKAR